jgi:hypothetical protein
MTQVSQIRLGQAVKFYRSHDKSTPLTGTVVGVQKNGNMVRIKTDEANGSVSRVEEAHCDDVTFTGSAALAPSTAKAEWSEHSPSPAPAAPEVVSQGAIASNAPQKKWGE